MPIRDRSGQRWQPSGPRASRTWSQRPKFVQGSLEPVVNLGAHTGSSVSVPSICFPFHPFPFAHLFSSFFSCLPLLHVLSSHSFRSFARTTVRALVCTRTSTSNSGFRSPRFRQWGFIGCPCAFGFSFIATTHTFVPSSPFSCLHPFVLAARTFAHWS